MANIANYSDQLKEHGREFYNQDKRKEGGSAASSAHKRVQSRSEQERSRTLSLHLYQSFSEESCCGLEYWLPGDGRNTRKIYSDPRARLSCSVEGGAEIPHICLTLRLAYKADPKDKSNSFLKLKMQWLAWNEKDTNHARPDKNGNHTFSAQLRTASLTGILLDQVKAKICEGTADKEGFQLRWACDVPPVCSGFTVQETPMRRFDNMQKSAIRAFVEAAEANRLKVYTRVRLPSLLQNWQLLTTMPIPTLAPYPLYDCQYHFDAHRFQRMDDIPDITHRDIQIHHRRRDDGATPGGARAPIPNNQMELIPFDFQPPITFVHEREYQAIQMIAMMRESVTSLAKFNTLFNREYTFQLYPASFLYGSPSSNLATFYVALEINVNSQDVAAEQNMELPSPGTPISVMPKTGVSRRTGPVWHWNKNKSQPEQPKGKDQDPSDARDTRSSSIDPNNPSSHGSHTKSSRWRGFIVASSIPELKDMQFPPNMIIAKITQPADDVRGGIILMMTATVTFGRPYIPLVPIKHCLQSIMWGNSGRGIPTENRLKDLLLSRDNHISEFHETETQIDPGVTQFLSSLGQSRNEFQKQAIAEAATIGKELITLITGPPGTGKTAVSTAIAQYSFRKNRPILIVCASNQALDVVAQRFADEIEKQNLSLEDVYRLSTDFAESPELAQDQFECVEPSKLDKGTLQKFKGLYPGFSAKGITDTMLEGLASSLRNLGVSFDRLSLGNRIISRTRKADLISSEEESCLLLEFVRWQYFIQREGNIQVTPPPLGGMLIDEMSTTHKELQNAFKHAFERLQEFYVSRAKVIFCTSSTAARSLLRKFSPTYVLVEEASQIHEAVCLLSIVPYYKSVEKIIFSGDSAQLSPTVLATRTSECAHAANVPMPRMCPCREDFVV